MKVIIFGTNSPNSGKGHNAPGYLITDGKYKILLDCGSGCNSLLVCPNDLINFHIFISHFHWDHFNDVPIIQYAAYSNHNLGLLVNPIDIWMPTFPISTRKIIENEKLSYANFHKINEDEQIQIGDMIINFCQTDHDMETYAIKVTADNKTIVYTSDTSFSAKDRLVEFAKNADILISESSLLEEHGFPEICSHLTARQAGILAKEANVKKLILTHFWPNESREKYLAEAKKEFNNVFIAKEEDIYEV